MTAKDDEMDQRLIRRRVAQFVDWGVRLMVVGCFLFIWRMYEAQQAFIRKMDNVDTRIVQLEKDTARIEGNMVTMETLKRVELYMELLMARAGIDQKVDLTSKELKK